MSHLHGCHSALPYTDPKAQASLLKVPEVEAEAVLWAQTLYGSLVQESWIPALSPWSGFLWPQVGVSEAGLQHEILRRAQDLLDVARVQPGTDSRLFPELFRGSRLLAAGQSCRHRAAYAGGGLGTKEAALGWSHSAIT